MDSLHKLPDNWLYFGWKFVHHELAFLALISIPYMEDISSMFFTRLMNSSSLPYMSSSRFILSMHTMPCYSSRVSFMMHSTKVWKSIGDKNSFRCTLIDMWNCFSMKHGTVCLIMQLLDRMDQLLTSVINIYCYLQSIVPHFFKSFFGACEEVCLLSSSILCKEKIKLVPSCIRFAWVIKLIVP